MNKNLRKALESIANSEKNGSKAYKITRVLSVVLLKGSNSIKPALEELNSITSGMDYQFIENYIFNLVHSTLVNETQDLMQSVLERIHKGTLGLISLDELCIICIMMIALDEDCISKLV